MTQVDNEQTATYNHDAFNRRIRVIQGSGDEEFVFNPFGQRTAGWNPSTGTAEAEWTWWGAARLSMYANNTTEFEHQDWLGTERARTNISGQVDGSFLSLPFGDGYTSTGSDDAPYHYATLDQDTSANDHAQFREYSNMAGRWFSPDPYQGSYDPTNPQSFNRYAYVLNNPLSFIDPLGLQEVSNFLNTSSNGDDGDGGYNYVCDDPTSGIVCFSGGSGVSGGGGDPGNNNPPPPKSPQRKQCETNAKQAFNDSAAGIKSGFKGDLILGAAVGVFFQPVAGCVAVGAVFSVGGPEAFLPGCGIGALAAMNPASVTVGAIQGAAGAALTDTVLLMRAQYQYNNQMAACSHIP